MMANSKLTERKSRYLVLSVLVIVAFFIYKNSLDVPFIFDDSDNIKNPSLRISELSTDSLMKAAVESTLVKRPVANISFAINYYFGEYNVRGYHFLNILIHVAGAFILFLLLRITLKLPVNKERYNNCLLPILASLLWLTHPLATQSVTYLVQRMNSLAAMFYVLSVLFYVQGRLSGYDKNNQNQIDGFLWFSASLISGILAIGSKEIAVTLPVVVFLYEWFFLQDLSWNWLKKKMPWLVALLAFLYYAAYFYLGADPIVRLFDSCNNRPFSSLERVMTECRVVIYYIGLLVYPNPNRLVFDYDFPLSTSLFSPVTTIFSLLLLMVIFAVAVGIAKKERFIAFCIFWFFVNLVLESSVICLEIIYEHRTYLPAMFFLAILPAVLYRSGWLNKSVVTSMLILAIVGCGHWTIERNKTWQDPVKFWQDSITKQPLKARGYNNLGATLAKEKKYYEAEEKLMKAIALLPDFPEAYANLALVQYLQKRFDEAEKNFKHALMLRNQYVEARLNLASLYKDQGKYEAALGQYKELYRQIPDYSVLNKELGQTLLRMGQAEESLFYLEKAYQKLPEDKYVLLDKGEAFTRTGKLTEAIKLYQKVIDIDAENTAANYNLGLLFTATGNEKSALHHYRKIELGQSTDVAVLYNLGNVYLRLGALENARSAYEKFIKNSSVLADTYNNLGLVYIRQGRLDEATKNFQSALRINPDHPMAAQNLEAVKQDQESRD